VTEKSSKLNRQKAGEVIIALAGNPNAGKTTLFNSLTGMRQKVANYSGVTVERKEGFWSFNGQSSRIIDLPGLYSIDATSIDEQIARDVLVGKASELKKPDLIIAVVDATNLERNLYLVTQLLDYHIPIVVVLTMIDLAKKQNIDINVSKLSELLEIPVLEINVSKKIGLDELPKIVSKALEDDFLPPNLSFESETENGKIFARYNFLSEIFQKSVNQTNISEIGISEKIDKILTHKVFGLCILALILLIVFQAIFSWATLPIDLLERGFGSLGDFTRANLSEGLLTDLLVDGVIAGVGGVVVFLPQILLLFFFLSLLEDSGYMSRAAFLLDRLMRGVGLHGKAFLPLLSSFACAIPGIMATRTIDNPKDRIATILIAPFMSCSARLPVYTLMIAVFFSGQTVFGFVSVGAIIMLSMYMLGIIAAIVAAWILKRTVLKSSPPPLIMELPPYRFPNIKTVLLSMFEQASMFLKRAGTVILAISIILWALMTFPQISNEEKTQMIAAERESCSCEVTEEEISSKESGYALRNSYAGKIGHIIEPMIKPLGFDWKIGVALVSSFAAREVLVSTLSILYNTGKEANEESETLIQAIKEAKSDDGTPTWRPLTAVTLMVFFVLAMQCMSTIAVVRRETNSWAWTSFMVVYMTVLAYVAALLTYQVGKFLGY
jgi:ferrous iron transport protein B